MRYHGMVIRPPSEAESYILQITYGCSHNRCTFCGTYQDKPFQVRPAGEVLEDVALAGATFPDMRRVFLADGNALVLGTQQLLAVLDSLGAAFNRLRRVGIYASARDILGKSDADLALLQQRKLEIVYLGLESGSDEVLRRVRKEITAAEMVAAVHKLKRAGIRTSVIAILGLGGRELGAEHAAATGRVVAAMDPEYLSLLTLMLVPGTELHRQWQSGTFALPEPAGLLEELRQVIAHSDGLSRCIFRTNHASNYLPLAGTLSRDKARLLAAIDEALDRGRAALRPEAWRCCEAADAVTRWPRPAAGFLGPTHNKASGFCRVCRGKLTRRPPSRCDSNTAATISTVTRPSSALHSGGRFSRIAANRSRPPHCWL